jgi:hypothetical protein
MAENEGDWYEGRLPLFVLEHIREVDTNVERLVASVAALRAAVGGFMVGAAFSAEDVARV